jgi:glycosyltransferase involved in cell wall biosynthesis
MTEVGATKLLGHRVNGATVTVGIPTFNRADLLRQAIESVLAQTYDNFRLLVSDNASTDETHEAVASFDDARLTYVRADRNIGMIGNFNRLIALAETEFLTLLPDDDRLYPDYLSSVIAVLQRHPRAGLVHTAVDEIGLDSRVRKYAPRLAEPNDPWTVEAGSRFLERSMTSTVICQSSATYRTRAIREARGMTTSEEPFADVPLFMRIAQNWDIAYLHRPLVGFRVHDATVTAGLAPRGDGESAARDRLLIYGQIMYERRMGFLDKAGLPRRVTDRYRSLARLRYLADRAGLGVPSQQTWVDFGQVVRTYPRILINPAALRFMAAQLGGRSMRHAASRLSVGSRSRDG